MRQEEFKNRYIIKILSSVLIAALNMVIQLLLPRIFTVEEYGYYSYNLNVFTSIVVIANLSASNSLAAKFSKRNDELGLVYFYLKFVALVALIVNLAIIAFYPFRFFQEAFAGQTLLIVLLGLETSLITKLLTDSISMYDASAISRFPAAIQIGLKLIVSASVVTGFLFGRYNLALFYITQIAATSIAIVILLSALVKDNKNRYGKVKQLKTIEYIYEYWVYCRPLILATATSQLVVIVMNWALMKWSGASQQAMFGAAWQINALITYVFSPYAELSKREFAIISEDKEALRYRFEQSLKMMAWLTSYFAVFIAFMSESIVPILFGDKYSQATLITGIIMFYTIFQSIGQLNGSYLISVEKTKANALISIVGQIITLACVFLFQVPNAIWPETLGATGIALNYLLANIITVILSIIYVSRDLKGNAARNVLTPIMSMLILSVLAFSLHIFVNRTIPGKSIWNLLLQTGLSGAIYTLIIGMVIWKKPSLIGVSRDTIRSFIKRS